MGRRGQSLTLSFILGQVRDLPFCLFKEPPSLHALVKVQLPLQLGDYHSTEILLWLFFLPLGSTPPTYTFACV